MTENRYNDELVKNHALIYSAIPHAHEMHAEVGKAIKEYAGKLKNKHPKVLEIGCGEGESTLEILSRVPNVTIFASDINPYMVKRAEKNITEKYRAFPNGAIFEIRDAFSYLPQVKENFFDVFVSTWTLHNFTNRQRTYLMKEARRVLRPNGLLVVMDKMYDENLDLETMFVEQIRMYATLDRMGRSDVKELIVQHERDDFQTGIRIDRGKLLNKLQDIGFSRVWTTKRIINDEVVCAVK